jgi:hypothetical protein
LDGSPYEVDATPHNILNNVIREIIPPGKKPLLSEGYIILHDGQFYRPESSRMSELKNDPVLEIVESIDPTLLFFLYFCSSFDQSD